jgi:hypothetical protein
MSDENTQDVKQPAIPPLPPADCSAAVNRVYIYMQTEHQLLRGYFESDRLVKLVKHFIRAEKTVEPPNGEISDRR